MIRAIAAMRLIFGGWMLLSGVNFFVLHLYPMPTGHSPLAIQLMSALVHSEMLNVAMAVQLITGALILAGLFVPLALCVVMPISVCAAYWAVLLEGEPLGAALALLAMTLNALLMLAYLADYRACLAREARALGEASGTYEHLFARFGGGTARGPFLAALIPLGLVALFYHYLVFGRTGQWAMLTLMIPAVILHARRLRDMGHSAWLLLLPALPIGAAIWVHMFSADKGLERPAVLIAIAISAAATSWGVFGRTAKANPSPI